MFERFAKTINQYFESICTNKGSNLIKETAQIHLYIFWGCFDKLSQGPTSENTSICTALDYLQSWRFINNKHSTTSWH